MAESKSVFITGASLTGSNGATNRTYQLPHTSSIVSGQTRIFLDGSALAVGAGNDYTIANGLITFLGEVYNDQPIEVYYQITSSDDQISTTSSAMCKTLELASHLKLVSYVPDRRATGSAKALENFGTGDNSTSLFNLNNSAVLAESYTLYYGSDEATALSQPLTETTHYTMDKDPGQVTLTAAGITLVGTDLLYAKYAFNSTDDSGKNLFDSELQAALDRAQSEIEEDTQKKWANGANETPGYGQITNEKHTGKGSSDRDYFLNRFPLPDVSTTLTSAVTADDATINVSSTNGFPSSGSITIESDKITYTGKTTTTFTGCTSVSAHDSGETVHPFVISISTTPGGTNPTFEILERDIDYDLDLKTGKVQLLKKAGYVYSSNYADSTTFPPKGLSNRFRADHYIYGYETIPKEIIKLCLYIAKRELMGGTYGKMIINGRKTDETDRLAIDEQWIEDKKQKWTGINSSNT
jgi:hypothetical protein